METNKTWQNYTLEFQEQDANLTQAIMAAKTALDAAKANLSAWKDNAEVSAMSLDMNEDDELQPDLDQP